MEPTLLAAGSGSAGTLNNFEETSPHSARTVLVHSRDGFSSVPSCSRRIEVGRIDDRSPVRETQGKRGPSSWTSGYREIQDELERTDLVVLTALLGGSSGTYLSRYVASLAREQRTLTLAVVSGRFRKGSGLPGRRVRSARSTLSGSTDFFLPVDAEEFLEDRVERSRDVPPDSESLHRYLANLLSTVINRVQHGSDVIGNLERLVHSDERSKALMKRIPRNNSSV